MTIHDEILSCIDEITDTQIVSESYVTEALVDYYDKELFLIQESGDTSESTLKKIWDAIKRFVKMIIDSIKKAFASFTNNRGKVQGNGANVSVSSIAADVLKSAKKNVPDNIDGWTFPKVNPKYITTESFVNDLEEFNIITEAATKTEDKEDGKSSNSGSNKVTIAVDPKSKIKGSTVELKKQSLDISQSGNVLKISYFGFGKSSHTKIKSNSEDKIDIPGQDKEWYSSPKVALHLMSHDDTRNKITEVVNLALKVMKHRKKEDIDALNKADKVSNIVKIFLKPESHFYEIPISRVQETQAWASKLLTDMEAFTSTDVKLEKLDEKTIKSLNMVVRLLMRIQISFNYISTAMTKSDFIDMNYYQSIKSLDLLDEFVGRCIKAGMLPKYVAYNAWLISNECIRGTGKYKPIFGHARATLFPPNDKIVIKIALSGLGTVSNETEVRFTKIFKDMDRIDLIAPVVKDFKNNALVCMERVNGNFDLSSKVLKDFTKKANDALTEYQKKTGKNLNIKVGSQHIGNVAFDNKHKVYRSIDYGVHYRETK